MELRNADYKWPRPGCPYNMPSIAPNYADNRWLYEPWNPREDDDPNWYVTDIATGSYGQVQRTFGRKVQVGFIPGSGVSDQEEVYHLEVRVIKPARGRHHKEDDIVIWMRPVKLCTPDEQDAFEL